MCAVGRSCGCGRATCDRGGTITFLGRVGHFRARLPAAGKLIQIQYLDGRKWRPAVKLGHTNRRGRFRIKYRFRRISRPTRIHFRILVPAEGGWPYTTGASRAADRVRQTLSREAGPPQPPICGGKRGAAGGLRKSGPKACAFAQTVVH